MNKATDSISETSTGEAYKALDIKGACDRIETAQHPVLIMHSRPDGDTLGSAVALAKIFGIMGKRAICICPESLPKRLAFLGEDFFTENYTITTTNTLITVDVASPTQMGGLSSAMPVYMMIDHHDIRVPVADSFVVPEAAACGELIFDIAKELIRRGKINKITESVADSLFAAISSDTGCFKYANVTPKTHRIAAELIECGAHADEINHLLFDSKDIKQLKAESIALNNLEVYDNGKLALTTITHAEKESAGIESEYFETAIDIVRSLRGVEIAMTIKENSKGEYKVSLRSCGFNVAKIAEQFGGGGHLRASGCTISAQSMEEAKKKLLSVFACDS